MGIIVTLKKIAILAVDYILKTQPESQTSDISAHSIRFSLLCHAENPILFNVLNDILLNRSILKLIKALMYKKTAERKCCLLETHQNYFELLWLFVKMCIQSNTA
jgi:hypothetical protein